MNRKPDEEGVKMARATMTKVDVVREFTREFISNGTQVKRIRAIWYVYKRKLAHLQGGATSGKFATAMSKLFGQALWETFLGGNHRVYRDLGLNTKSISLGRSPVVMFCEKDVEPFKFMSSSLSSFTYISSGQIPSFEVAFLAEFTQWVEGDKLYVITVTDFDAAGITISDSLISRLRKGLKSLGSTVEVVHLPISIPNVLDKFETYEQEGGKGLGVELEAIPQSVMEKAIVEAVNLIPRELFETEAFFQWRNSEYTSRADGDEELQRLEDEAMERRVVIRREVEEISLTFDTDFDFNRHPRGRLRKQVSATPE